MNTTPNTTVNPRIAALTDDLTPSQFQSLLTYICYYPPGASFVASIKAWRKANGLSVDRED